MTCGNMSCGAYSKDAENHCADTDIHKTKNEVQGKKDHVIFAPEFCSLYISEEQYEKVN